MAVTIVQLFAPTVLTTAATIIYTMPTSPASSILKNGRVRFLNTTAGAITVTAYAVPSGGTPVVGNEFLSAQSIAPGQYWDTDIPVLNAGATFQALASANTSITASELDGVLFS